MKKKKGFTLVELLAVIVILAVILIIAMPKISDVIKNSKEASLETTAKLIASQAEKKYTENQVLDGNSAIKCSDVAKINDADYESCNITFDDKGNAKVTIVGKGKFEGLKVVDGTKNSAKASDKKDVVETAAKYFSYEEVEGGISITGYQVGTANVIIEDVDKCKSYLINKFGGTEEDAATVCTGNALSNGYTIQDDIISGYIPSSDYEVAGLNVTYENGGGTDVVIPSQIDGKTVVAIGDYAFYDINAGLAVGITSVVIPSTLETIGSSAFIGNKLTNIIIPSSVIKIGAKAFYNNKITSITFPDTPITLGCNVFGGNPIMEDGSYSFPSNVEDALC